LIKNLEAVRPSAILDVVRSGEDMAKLVPGYEDNCAGKCGNSTTVAEGEDTGCGSAVGRSGGGEMATMEHQLNINQRADEENLETEITLSTRSTPNQMDVFNNVIDPGSRRNKPQKISVPQQKKATTKQTMGRCENCGYLSSQKICKACVLLAGLNKNRPKISIEASNEEPKYAKEARDDIPNKLADMGIGPG
jgi:cytoplasmic tRNA 2-thiolation protein 1